jgi:hypothetical protein
MPGLSHEGLVELFRRSPAVVADLLRASAVDLPPFRLVRTDTATLTTLVPPEYRSDLVILFEDDTGPRMVTILEAQLSEDNYKCFSWPAYLAVARSRYRCPAVVLVFAPPTSVARWAAKPVVLGPGNVFHAVVIGPEVTPAVMASDRARQEPELAVLSSIAHGSATDPAAVEVAVRIATVTLEACRDLPDERAVVYSDLVLASLSKAVYEALMTLPAGYELQSEFARMHRAEGRAEGCAEGRAALLRRLLSRRFGDLPGWAVGRIEAATVEQMDAWADAVLTASSLTEILGPE